MTNFKVNTDAKYKAEVFVEPNDFVKAITSDGRVLDIGRYDVSNTLFVDAGATPNTGIRGMATKPYHDIHDAVADAQPGDLVFVHTGEYNLRANNLEGSISKANIHIHFVPGTIVNYGYTPFNTTSLGIGASSGYFYCTGHAQFRARSDEIAFNRFINMNADNPNNIPAGSSFYYYIECDSVDGLTAINATPVQVNPNNSLTYPVFVDNYIWFQNSRQGQAVDLHLDLKIRKYLKSGVRVLKYRTGTSPGKCRLNIEVGEDIILDGSHGVVYPPSSGTPLGSDVFLINGRANYFSLSCNSVNTDTDNVIVDWFNAGTSDTETLFNFYFNEIRNLNSRLIGIGSDLPAGSGSTNGRFIIRGNRIETSPTSTFALVTMEGPQKILIDGPRLIGRNPLGPALIQRNTNEGSLRLKNVYLQTESDFCITTNQVSTQIVCESIIGSNKPLGPNVTAVNPSVFLPDVSTSTPSVTGDFLLKTGDTMEGTIVLQVEEITPSPNITLDFGDKNNFEIILDQNINLQNPINPTPGQSGRVALIQDGIGNRTISFGSNWKFAGNVTPQLSTGANEVDMLVYEVIDTNFIAAQLINFSETGSSGGGDSVLLSTLDTRFVNISGDTMTGDLTIETLSNNLNEIVILDNDGTLIASGLTIADISGGSGDFVQKSGDAMTGNLQISNNSWLRVRNLDNYTEVRDNLLQITDDGGLSWAIVENDNGNLIILSTGGDIELQRSSGDSAIRVDGNTGDVTVDNLAGNEGQIVTLDNDGTLVASGVRINEEIVGAQLGGIVDTTTIPYDMVLDLSDYALLVHRATSNNNILQGIAGGKEGKKITIINAIGTTTLTIRHDLSTVPVDQRILIPTETDLVLGQWQSAVFTYITNLDRWILESTTVPLVYV